MSEGRDVVARVAASVVLGSFGAVLRLDGFPSVLLAVAVLPWAAVWDASCRWRWPRVRWVLAAAAAAVVAVVATTPVVGRAPSAVTLPSVALAAWFVAPGMEGPGAGRRAMPWRWAGAAAVAAVQLLWLATWSNRLTGWALVVLVVLAAGLPTKAVRALVEPGRAAARAGRRAWRSSVRTTAAACRWCAGALRRAIASLERRAAAVPTADLVIAAVVLVVMAAATAPIWWSLSLPAERFDAQINDLPNHIIVSEQFRVWPPSSYSPHFLFPMLLRLASTVATDEVAATVVLSIAFGATGVVLYWIGRRRLAGRPGLGRAASLVLPATFLLLESPALLSSIGPDPWHRPELDPIGTGPQIWVLHTWASPTSVLLLPFALALVAKVVDLTAEAAGCRGVPRAAAWQLGALTVLATIAKPAVTPVLVVAVPMLWLLLGVRSAKPWTRLASGVLVPGVVITAAQTVFLASGANPAEHVGWTWDPFWLVELATLHRPVLWLAALLPAAAVVGWPRRYARATEIRLLWLCVGVSLVPSLLLRETGDHSVHANLAWTLVFSLILLQLFTVRFVVEQARSTHPWATTRATVAFAVVLALAGASLAAGVFHWLVLTGLASY